MRPLALDLFCGLGGWTDGLLAEGYDVIGFDIEQHQYGEHRYPGHLVIQDVRTLHGSQFRNAALIVASPPCQGYSYRAMPWKKAKALPPPCNALFEACFRIQREACEAAGRHIPLIVENVRGAQKWVGRARWNYGSFYLWGDVPALMPVVFLGNARLKTATGEQWNVNRANFTGTKPWAGSDRDGIKQGGSWFNIAHNTTSGKGQNPDGRKTAKDGLGGYGGNFGWDGSPLRRGNSKSPGRKMASAMIAKIPMPLSRYIAATFKPDGAEYAEAAE